MNVYPNPTRGNLHIEVKGSEKIQTAALLLYAPDGKPVYTIKKVQKNFDLDISTYPNGIYIMRLILNGNSYDWKIIKE